MYVMSVEGDVDRMLNASTFSCFLCTLPGISDPKTFVSAACTAVRMVTIRNLRQLHALTKGTEGTECRLNFSRLFFFFLSFSIAEFRHFTRDVGQIDHDRYKSIY